MSTESSRKTVRVLVVDDHPVFRQGLLDATRDDPTIQVCGEAATIASALEAAATQRPDVAIIDLTLGHENGLDLIAALALSHPTVRTLVLSGHEERVHADRALRAGALGYIMKDKAAAELLAAVHRVADGKPYVSPEAADRILTTLGGTHSPGEPLLDRLSNRERHVLRLMGCGLATRDIAEQLELSIKTVESHYAHMKDKLGLRTGRELMRVAVMWAEGK